MKKLKNKNCLITGAASGIGRSLAIGLAKEGMNLCISDIDMDKLEEVKKEIESLGAKVFSAKCDVSKLEDFKKLANNVYAEMGDIDLLINNAGIGGGGYIESLDLEADWKKIIDVNLWSVIYSINTFLPRMLERGFGHIVNTGSGAGVIGLPCHLHYVASKFAVSGITEGLHSELSSRGIIASVICPTVIKSNIIDKSTITVPEELTEGVDEKEADIKFKEFKSEFWRRYSEKGLTTDEAAKRYIKGIKKNKLYIFDKKIVDAAMFIKGISKNRMYKKVLRKEGTKYFELIESVLEDLGI